MHGLYYRDGERSLSGNVNLLRRFACTMNRTFRSVHGSSIIVDDDHNFDDFMND